MAWMVGGGTHAGCGAHMRDVGHTCEMWGGDAEKGVAHIGCMLQPPDAPSATPAGEDSGTEPQVVRLIEGCHERGVTSLALSAPPLAGARGGWVGGADADAAAASLAYTLVSGSNDKTIKMWQLS